MLTASSSISNIIINSYFNVPFPQGTSYSITSYFGNRIDPLNQNNSEFHNAVDLAANIDTDILASADGIVLQYNVTEVTGESVIIEHRFDGLVYRTTYSHMLESSVVVYIGQEIKASEKIGIIGKSGEVTGVHLHFSLQQLNPDTGEFEYIDPINIFQN